MSTRRISTNNHIIKNNQKNKEEKSYSKYIFPINNKDKDFSTFKEDKEIKYILSKNNDINKNFYFEDDEYNYEIYNKPISRYKLFKQDSDSDYKYNTISTSNSFQLKYKEIFIFNRKYRRFKENQNNNSIEVNSNLNLSYEIHIKDNKYNICADKRKKINDKNKRYLNEIIRVFDKNHKIIINNKYLKKKAKIKNNYLLNNNKIKYNNYIKNKNFSKFSKKNQNKLLRKNHSSLMDSHPKVYIPINKEDKTKNKNHKIHEISNYKISTTERKGTIQKNEVKNVLSPINDIKSVTKKLFYKSPSPNQSTSSKSNQLNINANEYAENKKLKYQNIYIGLNKKNILEKKNETVNKRDSINNNKNSYINLGNHNSKILFQFSNRKSRSIFEDTSLFGNNNSINESNLKNDKENIEKKSPKLNSKKLQNFKNSNIIEEKEKEKEEDKKDYNKRYKKLIYVNNNYRRKEKSNIVQNNKINNNNNFINNNENKRNIYNKKLDNKNNVIKDTLINQNNNRKSYLSKIIVPPSNNQKQNISYINRRKAFQISINEKNSNNSNIRQNFNSNYNKINHSKNILEQKNKNEISRIRLEKTIYYFPEKDTQNKIINETHNFATPSAPINKTNKKIFLNKDIKNEQIFLQNKTKTKENITNIDKNKENLLPSKSCIINPEGIKNDKNDKNNYEKNSNNSNKNYNNMINSTKKIMNTDRADKRKEIKIERQIIPRRSFENKNEEQKYVKVNRSINQNGYRIFNISKFSKDERNSLTNTSNSNSISMSHETNKYINKFEIIKDKNDINLINLPNNKYLNKFQRSNHKYYEIKSTSSDKIVKITENNEDIKEQSYKIIRNSPQIQNYTSMDNIKGIRRRYFTKETKDKQNDQKRK